MNKSRQIKSNNEVSYNYEQGNLQFNKPLILIKLTMFALFQNNYLLKKTVDRKYKNNITQKSDNC